MMATAGRGFGVVVSAALASLAGGCLDALGHGEDVVDHRSTVGTNVIEDDRIEDKHPIHDPARTVTEVFKESWNSCSITMNKTAAVTKLDIVPFEGDEKRLEGRLFRGRTEALVTIDGIAGADPIPSMEVVHGALKPFNDGLYAAVELEAETAKRQLFATLAARIAALASAADPAARPAVDDAAVLVGTAQILAGEEPALDAALMTRARNQATAFQADTGFSRPIGFYTWMPALERVFTRDRFLQNRNNGESFGAFAAIAYLLGQDEALLADYQQVAGIYAGLTNPYNSYTVDALVPYVTTPAALASLAAIASSFNAAHPPLKACLAVQVAFLPASRSKDSDYFDELYCNSATPPANLLDVLIDAVRSGALDLTPSADAGWYEYQIHALETLLLPERAPESQNLLLTKGYKKKLIETFKSLIIQTRETHVKQLSFGARAASGEPPPPVDAYPLLPAEPFPTFYARTARAYRFLRTFLQAAMGPEFLTGTNRVVESGARGTLPLATELDQRVALLYGLAFIEADAVGMARGQGLLPDELAEIDMAAAVETAREWLKTWMTDQDVVRDPRVIVPVFQDHDRQMTTYWAVVGVKALVARAEFVAGHEPEVTPTGCWTGKFVPRRYTLLIEETAELELPFSKPPPTRAELRAICDAHTSKGDIVRALGGR
jgi:hypothetical protein